MRKFDVSLHAKPGIRRGKWLKKNYDLKWLNCLTRRQSNAFYSFLSAYRPIDGARVLDALLY